MRYPFSPEALADLPDELVELFQSLEDTLLHEICTRLNLSGELNEVTVQDIRALRSLGIDLKDIKKAIQKATKTGEKELNKLLDDVVERNQKYYTELIDAVKLTQPTRLIDIEDTWAIYEQTRETYRNITRSMGFLVDNGRTKLEPAKAYQWALDSAVLQVQSGAISYNQAIRSSVQQLANSGLKMVNYESGHVDSVDVAVRRAVMTGVAQLNQKYTEESMRFLQTDLVQVEAHAGARDVDGVNGWENHKKWQGKLYRWAKFTQQFPNASKKKYPDFERTCGYGDVAGILGANCRHSFGAFIEGVMERSYTDKELAHIDDGLGCEYDGKKYSAYEATQMQRRLERQIRKQKRRVNAFKDAGLSEDTDAAKARLTRLESEYKGFSKAAGLPEQTERKNISFVGETAMAEAQQLKVQRAAEAAQAALQNEKNAAIIKEKAGKGGAGVQTIGKIDIEKYRVVSDNIRTDEVVITDERIQHIKDHHPNDYERFVSYIPNIINEPDYIIEANKDHTAVILKEIIGENSEKFKLILRLCVPSDPKGYKNSVISFWKVGETTWRKTLKNKKILYKRG